MAKLIRIKNQVFDLEAIRYASYVKPRVEAASSLRLIIDGVALDVDQGDVADELWGTILERLPIEFNPADEFPEPLTARIFTEAFRPLEGSTGGGVD